MHASLCDQLLDLVQNSLEAGATQVAVTFFETADVLEAGVQDNGCGMSEELQRRALDPFFSGGGKHRHRKVGLGLAFLKQMVDATGGRMVLSSAPGEGTAITFRLPSRHPDMPPAGDLPTAWTAMMVFDGDYELTVERRLGDAGYRIGRRELAEALGELETATSIAMVKDYAASQEEALKMQKGLEHGSTDIGGAADAARE